MFKLAINAGHWNGTTRGVPASLSPKDHPNEWVLNDRVVRAVIKKLADYDGIQIRRIDDPSGVTFVEDADRMKKANAMPADFYLAIHHNGGIGGGTGGGIVAYTYLRPTAGETAWQRELYDALIAKTGLKGNRATPLGKADLFECRETAMDAVLLELGFMDSKTDIKSILAPDWADKCARAITEVIVRRAGLPRRKEVMQKGDKGLGVYTLKKLMGLAGVLGIPLPSGLADNGDFGDGTERNLKALQSLASLPPTGVADAETVAHIFALLKQRAKSLTSRSTTLQFQYDGMKAQIKELQQQRKK
ncbi:MAG: N-acetylmuramoyl-L-alanine amidase [Clostridia bacterium]|nr:N-acetylmuramoyl-L-alanine amidase [Clostridia bacterium]